MRIEWERGESEDDLGNPRDGWGCAGMGMVKVGQLGDENTKPGVSTPRDSDFTCKFSL